MIMCFNYDMTVLYNYDEGILKISRAVYEITSLFQNKHIKLLKS
jgi:hypothetical protein